MKKSLILLVLVLAGGLATISAANSEPVRVDPITNLMWQTGAPGEMSWTEAKAHCELGRFGGYDDWRQPNREELHTLYKARKRFPDLKPWYYWSADVFEENPTEAWLVEFSYGTVFNDVKSHIYFSRCVRGGH